MRVKKIMEIHSNMQNLDDIKQRIREMKGHNVAWELNLKDRRRHQQGCQGTIKDTYRNHFSVETPYGYTSFNYVDLLTGHIVLHDAESGSNILNTR